MIYRKIMHKNKVPQTKVHKCKICGLINNNAWGLTIHMRRHNKEHKAKCEQCPATFVNNYELSKHINSEHLKEKKYQCRFCSLSFINLGNKYYHEDTHGLLRHKCKFCDEIFSSRRERRSHQRTHQRSDEHACKYCFKKFSNEEFLQNHNAIVHLKSYECIECKMSFVRKYELTEHNKTVHKTNASHKISIRRKNEKNVFEDGDFKLKTYVFNCAICSEEFNFKIELNNHIEKVHAEEKDAVYKFTCDICFKSFNTKNRLQGHMIGHGPKKFKCKYCPYQTARGKDLDKHVRTKHELDKCFKCSICNESFLHRSTYILHKMRHAEAKFKCDLCDAMFSMRQQLSRHKKYKHYCDGSICDQCGKKFSNPPSLRSHLRKMHNKTNVQCLCNRCQNTLLIKEIKDHLTTCSREITNNKIKVNINGPVCSECNITFSIRSDIIFHFKELHPNSVYSCKFCTATFLSSESLQKHSVKHEFKKKAKQRIHNKILTIDEKRTLKSMDGLNDKFNVYECFGCGMPFYSNDKLIQHSQNNCISLPEEIYSKNNIILRDERNQFIIYKLLKDKPEKQLILEEFFITVFPDTNSTQNIQINPKLSNQPSDKFFKPKYKHIRKFKPDENLKTQTNAPTKTGKLKTQSNSFDRSTKGHKNLISSYSKKLRSSKHKSTANECKKRAKSNKPRCLKNKLTSNCSSLLFKALTSPFVPSNITTEELKDIKAHLNIPTLQLHDHYSNQQVLSNALDKTIKQEMLTIDCKDSMMEIEEFNEPSLVNSQVNIDCKDSVIENMIEPPLVSSQISSDCKDSVIGKIIEESPLISSEVNINKKKRWQEGGNFNTCINSDKKEPNVVSPDQLIKLLQQKTVKVGGLSFLPFNELVENLKIFKGVGLKD